MDNTQTHEQQGDYLRKEFTALGMSQRQVGEAVGYSSGTINQIYKGTYANPDPIIELMIGYLRRIKSRKDVIETKQFNEGIEFMDSIHGTGGFGVLTAGSGAGKSFLGRYYSVTHEKVVYNNWIPGMNAKEMLFSLAYAVVSSPSAGTPYDITMQIIKSLRREPRTLILDEADQMPEKMANIIRSIHDDGNCSMVLTGIPKLETILKGGTKNTAYVYSRITAWRRLGQATKKDLRNWADHYGFHLSDDMLESLLRWVGKSGEYRMLKNIFRVADKAIDQYDVHDDAIFEAYKQVLSREDGRKPAFAA